MAKIMKAHLINLLVWLSQTINVLFLFGNPDQTISSRAHIAHLGGRSTARNIINSIVFWQEDHCLSSFLADYDNAVKIIEAGK